MGMHYSVTFHNAVIKRARFPELMGEDAPALEDVADLDRRARDHVCEILEMSEIGQDPETGDLDLDGAGYWDSASYGFGGTLEELLLLCEPGAYTHEIDVEEGTGAHCRNVVNAKGSIDRITPTVAWPGMTVARVIESPAETMDVVFGEGDPGAAEAVAAAFVAWSKAPGDAEAEAAGTPTSSELHDLYVAELARYAGVSFA